MILYPISIETCFAFEYQGNKLKRSTGPSSLTCFHARGKKTKLSNNKKTSFSSSSLTQSLSGLKYALASFFKPSHRCGGETTKSNSVSYRFLSHSQKSSNTVIGRWRLCWPLCHQFSIVAWASGLIILPSR